MTFMLGLSMLGATETAPFYVSKVSASGAYSSIQFKVLWEAFRQEYSVSNEGIFKPYYFTGHVLDIASKSSRNDYGSDRFFRLFHDQDKSDSFQNLTGNQDAYTEANKYVSNQLAMDGARRYGARLTTVSIGAPSSVAGVHACDVNVNLADNVDVRDTSATPRAGSASSIVFCDPKNIRTGKATLYIEGRYSGSKGSRIPAQSGSEFREVGTILDNRENQESFVSSLKAGSSFKVFWFKETTCTNCGGLGRLSTLAVNQSGGAVSSGKKSSPFGGSSSSASSSILSLTPGVSTARDKCPACYGTGKRMRGYITAMLWDDKGPTFDAAR